EVAYDMVLLCGRRIVETLERRKNYAGVLPYVKEFWTLYWGVMILVEGPDVEGAMVAFGQVLLDIERQEIQTPSPVYTQKIKDFARAEFPLWGGEQFTQTAVGKRPNATELRQLQVEFPELPTEVADQWLKIASDRPVSPKLVSALKQKLKPLQDALAKERARLISTYAGV